MVKDLNMDVEIIDTPIIRESDGLALSSRNVYLSAAERQAALVLSRSLKLAQAQMAQGEQDISALKELVIKEIQLDPLANIDYVEILSLPDLKEIKQFTGEALLALAVRFGRTRLIDNTILEQ